MKKLISIKEVLEKVAKKTGLDLKIKESLVLKSWQNIVGNDIANHTVPKKYLSKGFMLK